MYEESESPLMVTPFECERRSESSCNAASSCHETAHSLLPWRKRARELPVCVFSQRSSTHTLPLSGVFVCVEGRTSVLAITSSTLLLQTRLSRTFDEAASIFRQSDVGVYEESDWYKHRNVNFRNHAYVSCLCFTFRHSFQTEHLP